MFSKVSDASKVAFAIMISEFQKQGIQIIDCQMTTKHLMSLGAKEIDREQFLFELEQALQYPSQCLVWHR